MADVLPDFVLIDGYIIDVAVSEEHSFEAEMTSYPIEGNGQQSGSNFITDNVRIKPMTVTLEGIVSSTPLADVAAQRSDPASSPTEAYRKMLAIRKARKPVTITTSLDTYQNMILTSFSVPRSASTASCLHFRAKFEQADFVTVDKAQATIPTAMTPKVKTVAPVPLAKTAVNTALFRVIVQGNHGLWWDDNIGGWRNTGIIDTRTANWVFTRDMPFGADRHLFETSHPPDSYWKSQIQAQNASGERFNPYDPFQSPDLVIFGVARSVTTVAGLIVDSTGN